jgi:hypothetical protein
MHTHKDIKPILIGGWTTPEGAEFLKLTALLESARSREDLSPRVHEWLAHTGNGHLRAGFDTLLAELSDCDAKVVAEWNGLIERNDARLREMEKFNGKDVTFRDKIEALLPMPVTRIVGYRLAATPEASLNALSFALTDIGEDRENARRFLGSPFFPFGYIARAEWEKHEHSPMPDSQRQQLLEAATSVQLELGQGNTSRAGHKQEIIDVVREAKRDIAEGQRLRGLLLFLRTPNLSVGDPVTEVQAGPVMPVRSDPIEGRVPMSDMQRDNRLNASTTQSTDSQLTGHVEGQIVVGEMKFDETLRDALQILTASEEQLENQATQLADNLEKARSDSGKSS